jgi:hydrogenase expression/formation protein HypD
MYANAVSEEGNTRALSLIDKYFEVVDYYWRGIGVNEGSSLRLRPQFAEFDGGSSLGECTEVPPKGCRCRDVILGRVHPVDCPLFGKTCTPLNAVGPCMVSSEGVCGIWYKNRGVI